MPEDKGPDNPNGGGPGLADAVEKARAIAGRALAERPRTKQELSQLLARRGVRADAAEQLLSRFEEVGLVDDEEFARAWVTSRQQRKGLSGRALRVELARKGVSSEVAAAAVADVGIEDEMAAARALVERREPRLAGLEPAIRRRRLEGLLRRRGFGSEVVSAVLAEVSTEAEVEGC